MLLAAASLYSGLTVLYGWDFRGKSRTRMWKEGGDEVWKKGHAEKGEIEMPNS